MKFASYWSWSVVILRLSLAVGLMAGLFAASSHAQTRPASTQASGTLTIRTEPGTAIWVNELRRGTTDESGVLRVQNLPRGRLMVRARAIGFSERTVALPPGQRGTLDIKLVKSANQAEIIFQQAESAREKSRDEGARNAAADLYRRALKLRPSFPAARVGLARVLLDLNDYNAALEQISEARRARPVYPEASAVEGRILRLAADQRAAEQAFRRAIREGRGNQPEAHTGLGLLLEEQGRHEEAADAFERAIFQLYDTEPILYQLLGAAYEKIDKYREAVEAYEKYLQLAPDGNLAPAIRSVIDQLRRQAEEQDENSY